MFRMKLRQVALLLVALFMMGDFAAAQGEGKAFDTDAADVMGQFTDMKPAEGMLWLAIGKGVYRAIDVGNYPDSLVGNIPADSMYVSFTVSPDVVAKTKDLIMKADFTRAQNCRYTYFEAKPQIAFMLKRATDGSLVHFDAMSTEEKSWQKRAEKFMAAEKLSNGELAFSWRLLYRMGVSRLTPSHPVHMAMDSYDGEISTEQYLSYKAGRKESDAIHTHHASGYGGQFEGYAYSSADGRTLERVTVKIESLRKNLQVNPADWSEITSVDDIVKALNKAK